MDNLNRATLSQADLRKTDLRGASLGNAKLVNANLDESNLNETNLTDADLLETNLILTNLSKAKLKGANLQGANLRKACLQRANLQGASLRFANLIGANLDEVNLRYSDLTGIRTYGWSIKDADLTDAIMPDGELYQGEEFYEKIYSLQGTEENSKPENSMTRKIIRTDNAPPPVGPYNQAVVATGQMLFLAGQIAIDPRINNIVYTDDITKQTEQVMANLSAILQEAGAGWTNVVKTTVYLKDMNDFAAMNAVYAKYFDSATAPARACVEVSRLPKDVLVEIDCIAVL